MMFFNPLLNTATAENLLEPLAQQSRELLSPVRQLNSLLVNQLARMTDTQLKALEGYSLMGLEQLKKATEVKDSDSAHRYSLSQAEFFSAMSRKAMDDARQLAEMNRQLQKDIETLLQPGQH